MISKFMKDINPYHVVFGIVLGAGGFIIGLQFISVVRRRRERKKDRIKEKAKAKLLIHSPEPPVAMRNGNASNIETSRSEMANGHLLPQPVDSRENLNGVFSHNDEKENHSVDSGESTKLLNLLYNLSEVQCEQDHIYHRGISCNSCNANPLTGIRFKCVNCVDYDVCLHCEPFCNHDSRHVFLKIAIPIPPMANPRTALLPVFYPGKNCVPAVLPWNDILHLREISHFDISRIGVLYEQYKSLADNEKGISEEVFCLCLGPLSSKRNLLVEQLFKFYDADGNGFIDFREFINGLSVLSKGTKDERLKYIFKGYDVDGDGYLSRDDFQQMLKAYHLLSMELVRDVVRSCEEEMMATYDDSGNRPISAVFNAPIPESGSGNVTSKAKARTSSTDETSRLLPTNFIHDNILQSRKNKERLSVIEAMTQDAITELVDEVMREADTDKDGKLSEKEFYEYALTNPSLLAWFEAIDTIF